MNPELLQLLARALGPEMERQKAAQYGIAGPTYMEGYKHDVSTVAPIQSGYMHGEGGLLTFPGVDPVAFHTVMAPRGILNQIPTKGSLETSPTFWTITGVGADTGSEPDGVCDDAPVGGLIRGCLSRSVFGRYERATHQLEINRLGQRINRGDPLDIRLVGTPFEGMSVFGGMDSTSPGDILTNEVSQKFWQRNVSFHRLLSKQLWEGNPTNNSAAGGYKEMTGLQLLVNTGYNDVETGEACPAMDSIVRNYNGRVDDVNNNSLVAQMFDIAHQLKFRADRTGVDPVRWVIAMKYQLFYELTSLWPCSYLTYRCLSAPGMAAPASLNIDAQDAIRLRDEMRTGKYLLIDGDRWEVVLDDGIPETESPAGVFKSDIYFLPMSVVGGTSVLFLEYFQFTNPSIQTAMNNMVLGRIEGAFITWPKQTNLCVQWQSKIEPRLVLRTPWLAARLQNVAYAPIQHLPDVYEGDAYAFTGGRESRPGPSMYDIWDN